MNTIRSIASVVTVGCLIAATAACTSSDNKSAAATQSQTTGTSSKGLPAVPGIVDEIAPSVVTITTPVGLGSGVVFGADGAIVTAAHVVEDQSKKPFSTVHVQFADGKKVSAKLVGVDDVTDVAVITADRSKLPVPEYSSTEPRVGEMCVVVGSPLGLQESATAGIVSGLHRNMPPTSETPQGLINLIQTDAAISPGNSGGAVVNGDAQVIGLSEAYIPPKAGAVSIGFVTPASVVTDVAQQLMKTGQAKHAFLGIQPLAISPQLAKHYGLPSSGVLVAAVTDGGPAQQAGIEQGDVITQFAGTKISTVTDLLAALRKKGPGQQVTVVVNRDGQDKSITVTLTDRP